MISCYMKSVIVYLIVYWALKQITKTVILIRDDIDYSKYIRGKGKGIYYTFCFIPILRVLVIAIVFFVTFAKKESLDRLFKKEGK